MAMISVLLSAKILAQKFSLFHYRTIAITVQRATTAWPDAHIHPMHDSSDNHFYHPIKTAYLSTLAPDNWK